MENEFKEEHYRRIAYANQKFAAAIPGWKTDRGRIYISYGPPDQKESHPSGGTYRRPASEGGGTITAVPFEQWLYRHIDGVGDNVIIEFVDPNRNGEYRMTMDPNEKDALLVQPPANGPKFYVQGGVMRPGGFPLAAPTRVLQALVNAGGFTSSAVPTQIVVQRVTGESVPFDYREVIAGRNAEQNVFLKAGDIIIVKSAGPGEIPLVNASTPKAGATVQRMAAGATLLSVPLLDFGNHKVTFLRARTDRRAPHGKYGGRYDSRSRAALHKDHPAGRWCLSGGSKAGRPEHRQSYRRYAALRSEVAEGRPLVLLHLGFARHGLLLARMHACQPPMGSLRRIE